jgi:8-oxo-dGTP pyrophosphatase MutT (NUDIX family)
MDKHIRREVQPRVLAPERIIKESVLQTLNPMTNLSRHNGISAAGVLFLSKSTGRCLFQLRNSDKKGKHTWGFWGGMMDDGETTYDTIQRELMEEIGLVPELKKLNPIDVYQSKDKNFMYYSFVYLVDDEFIPNLNKESAGYAWVDIGNWPMPLHFGAKSTLGRNKGVNKLRTILKINM